MRGILGLFNAEIACQPALQSCFAIPFQALEVIANRMIGALLRAHLDRLVHHVLAEPPQAGPLQKLLHHANVGIGDRTDDESRIRLE